MAQEMQQQQAFQREGHALDVETQLNASVTGQHLMLGEFVLPFAPGEADPTTQTSNITDGRAQLWVDDDGILQLSIYSTSLGGWTTVGQSVLNTVTDLVDTRFALQESTTDIKDVLVNAEMLEDNGETPLDLDGGELTVGAANISGTLTHTGTTIAVYSQAGGPRFTVAGSRSGDPGAVLGLILSGFQAQGFLDDITTA